MEQDYLEFLHITKNFPGVTALDDVSMSVHRGEIHALVGENGAGKSTLMNILGGNLQPNGGELRLDGHPVKISSPIDAYRKGIGFVHQESNLLENLSVCENVFLGREPGSLPGAHRPERHVPGDPGVLPALGISIGAGKAGSGTKPG